MPTATADRSALTARQAEIFAYLYGFARDNGYQPAIRHVGDRLGIKSPNAVAVHLQAMADKGWIARGRGSFRCVRFLRKPNGDPFTGFADKGAT